MTPGWSSSRFLMAWAEITRRRASHHITEGVGMDGKDEPWTCMRHRGLSRISSRWVELLVRAESMGSLGGSAGDVEAGAGASGLS